MLSRLLGSPNKRKIIKNVGWLTVDNFFRMGVGLLVGVWVARYLGPERFGLLNYASAYVAMFASFATLGLGSIVIRDLVKSESESSSLLGTALGLRILGSLAALLISSVSIIIVRPEDQLVWGLVIVSALGSVFQTYDVIDMYFQSKVLSKYSVWAKNLALLFCTAGKVASVLSQAPLIIFAIIGLAETLLTFFFSLWLYSRRGGKIRQWSFSLTIAKRLLSESWPLILSSVASILNMRIGQVLIGSKLNDLAVGNYSAAVRISEIWLVLPGMIGASIYPSIIAAKEQGGFVYRKRIFQVFYIMSAFAMIYAGAVSFFSEQITVLLYGYQFEDAGNILAIHIWSGVPFLSCFVFSQVFLVEKLTRYVFYTSLISPLLTLVLSFVLVNNRGTIGVALAVTLTAFLTNFISVGILYFKVMNTNGQP